MIRPAPGTVREEFETAADFGWGIVLHKPEYMGVRATEYNHNREAPRWWYNGHACREIARRLKVVRR